MAEQITVSVTINAPVDKVWNCFTQPDHITKWNFASDDWECTKAVNTLEVGKKFSYHMGAKNKSFEFDFGGTYSAIVKGSLIEYTIADGRKVIIDFLPNGVTTTINETFEMEGRNPHETQRQWWQAILDNFKKHVESC